MKSFKADDRVGIAGEGRTEGGRRSNARGGYVGEGRKKKRRNNDKKENKTEITDEVRTKIERRSCGYLEKVERARCQRGLISRLPRKVMRCDNKSRSGLRGERRGSLAYLGSRTNTGCAAFVKLPR